MAKASSNNTSLWPAPQRLLRTIASLLLALGIATALFIGISRQNVPADRQETNSGIDISIRNHDRSQLSGVLIAYTVDYEMDKARAEKTVEHYGDGIRPYIEDALKYNEDNPNSKPAAENSFKRESSISTILNEVLPETLGSDFTKDDLLNMENSDK